jgi:putative PIN family toxin of toxin-antitoxin system
MRRGPWPSRRSTRPAGAGAEVRAVLDPNILISALLSPSGTPAGVLRAWIHGGFELVMSPRLLEELERALAYPKIRKRVASDEARSFCSWLRSAAEVVEDPGAPPSVRSRDPDDDYLIALAEQQRALLVSGDDHLLELADRIPVFTAAGFLERFVPEPPAR